jgi:hypothetical protein
MNNDFGDRESRYQQGDSPDLTNQYRKIGIPAVSAAANFHKKPRPQQQQQAQSQFLDFED